MKEFCVLIVIPLFHRNEFTSPGCPDNVVKSFSWESNCNDHSSCILYLNMFKIFASRGLCLHGIINYGVRSSINKMAQSDLSQRQDV